MTKIQVELSPEYKEHLDLLKQIVPNKEWKQVTQDSEMVEVLIDEFIAFVQHHAAAEQEWWGCCGGWDHSHGEEHKHEWHDHSKGWCGCSH